MLVLCFSFEVPLIIRGFLKMGFLQKSSRIILYVYSLDSCRDVNIDGFFHLYFGPIRGRVLAKTFFVEVGAISGPLLKFHFSCFRIFWPQFKIGFRQNSVRGINPFERITCSGYPAITM